MQSSQQQSNIDSIDLKMFRRTQIGAVAVGRAIDEWLYVQRPRIEFSGIANSGETQEFARPNKHGFILGINNIIKRFGNADPLMRIVKIVVKIMYFPLRYLEKI